MADYMAQMLDELMGKDRDLLPNEKSKSIRWDDPEVCKYYICGFCPHDLFINTRADLGPCLKIHDDELQRRYQKSNRVLRMGYEQDFLRYLESIWNDVEKRISRGKSRLKLTQEMEKNGDDPSSIKGQKITMITDKINSLLQEIEELGCEGNVEKAQGLMKVVEQLKKEKDELHSVLLANLEFMRPQEKEMEVCEVCGAFLIVGDAPSRVDDHLNGKQHTGYARVKSAIGETKALLSSGPFDSNSHHSPPASNSWEGGTTADPVSAVSPVRRSSDKEYGRLLTEREIELRQAERQRSRSRERKKRSKSRERHHHSHSSRRRSKERRSRSRDRRRNEHSKRKDSKRSRSRSPRSSRHRRSRSRSHTRRRSKDRRRDYSSPRR